MKRPARPAAPHWTELAFRLLPFADAASADLPLGQLLRLSLFQVTVGMATVLLNGTLNRVMVVELGTPTWLVALLIAVPLLVAPFRALIGHKSDTHRSVLGWRRVPYIWFGTLMQFGGLAIMPFALLLLGAPERFELGLVAATAAFLLTGTGFHVTQTAGLALATDLAPEDKRPRAVALLYVMLLVGMMFAAFVIGGLLMDYSATMLVQVIQGCAVLTIILNVIALWKQEARNTAVTAPDRETPVFSDLWQSFVRDGRNARLLTAIGIGAAGFAMQDALLEPYGGEILGLSVGATTGLTGAWALGSLIGFMLSGRWLARGWDPLRLAGGGLVIGINAFLLVLFAGPFSAPGMLYLGALGIGLGLGLFSVGTLMEAMAIAKTETAGLALGAWGAVQASCAGAGIAIGGLLRDLVAVLVQSGDALASIATRASGYAAVYMLEIALLLAGLAALGPLVGPRRMHSPDEADPHGQPFGLREFPT
ncbi:BCD family MFS transporter [Erythrobacter sanguineus]|uniref:MFS transporter, BCD family, chlorophyll transporter n=1 Tax=Erythrobacter sanguineus TaxID=198312 RepID=A0A1M7RZM6_9SPHN|nr:BCD family MFS transporter [Erythrobacter sanguineus]SHN51542.1 MFS transporter, BCD family, chlorophyll transporter [Erythrobacter sanguineus]